MEETYRFYQDTITAFSKKLSSLKKRIHIIGSIRLLLFVGASVCLWFIRNENWEIWMIVIALFLIPFVYLILVHNRLFNKKLYTETLINLNNHELQGLDYNFSAFDGAPEFSNATHPYGLDLDLFGENSLFQSINRTVTYKGRTLLANWFSKPDTNPQKIQARQQAVKELADNTQLRQHFYITGSMHKGMKNDVDVIESLSSETIQFAKNPFWTFLSYLFPLAWVLGILLYTFSLVNLTALSILFTICFVVSYSQTKKINYFHQKVSKMETILSTYSKLMKCLESYPFQSKELIDISKQLSKNETLASSAIKKLSRYTGNLDQRYNLLGGFILNVLLLWDIRQTCHIERWKIRHTEDIRQWFDALAHFDALSSLGSFAFNHPTYTYPQLTDRYFLMKGNGLGHPLLPRDICVTNDINIGNDPKFLIVTGANMAGKSTYLRTMGVNYLLALTGAPVFADSLTIYPAQMVTSLRTADSLVNHESYFFAELKRLKMIIDNLEKGEEMFIILDEILKGTNSVDKQKGSLALMKQLINYKACGIIATHDLILGTLADEFPNMVKNYRFEADIKENELTFSYKLREGIAQNMNACFLMKQMGITV